MEPWGVIVFFFLLPLSLILGTVIPIAKKHYKITGSIVNYDSFMRKYIYKVNMSEEEIISTLKEGGAMDELFFDFDFESSVAAISDGASSRKYFFEIQACEGIPF